MGAVGSPPPAFYNIIGVSKLGFQTTIGSNYATPPAVAVFSPDTFSGVAPYTFHTSFPLMYAISNVLMWSQTPPRPLPPTVEGYPVVTSRHSNVTMAMITGGIHCW